MQLSDETIAEQLTRRLVDDNYVHSLYVRQFSPRDVVYVSAKIYHRGARDDVREIRTCSATSLQEAMMELLRACDVANEVA